MPFILRIAVCLSLSAFLFSTGCKKNSTTTQGTGCISRYQPEIKERKLPVTQYDSVTQFFAANGLSLDTVQPLGFFYSGNDIQGRPFYQVPSRKFINGLPVYNARLIYDFSAGVLSYSEMTGYDYPLASGDTTAHLSSDQVRTIFLASNPDTYAYGIGNLVAVPHHPTHWADSCIFTTMQYGEKAMFDSCCRTAGTHLLTRVWTVQQIRDSKPLAFINDETGSIVPVIIYTAN